MSIYTNGVVPWNSLDNNTRLPQASELEGGYPCGEADQKLFNFTAGYPIGQIYNLLLAAGVAPDFRDLTQMTIAIERLFVIDTAITKTVFGVGADFADFNAANQWLSKRRIAASGSVTLSIGIGQKIITAAQRLYHPDGQRITVAGAALVGGGYPSLSTFVGAGNSASTRAADKATNLAMLRARFQTEIRSQGVGGQAVVFTNIGNVQDILFSADDVASDLFYLFGGATRLTRVACVGALGRSLVTRGILMALNNVCAVGAGTSGISLEDSSGGALTGGTISAWNCGGDGLAVRAGSVLAAEAGASMGAAGNGLAGMSANFGGKINVNPSLGFARNGKYGFYARSGGHIYAIGCEAAGNTDYGFFSEDSSFIDATNTIGANGLSGYAARNSSFIIATGGTAGTLAPVANTNGNGNSYIRV